MVDENWCYIGPTAARLGLKKSTLVLGSEPLPQLKELMELKPVLRALFVPTSKLAVARRNMERRGTIENTAAGEVIKLLREKMAAERKVNVERK